MIVQGYTPRQLQYGTGGPKKIENLYTRDMLEDAFRSFRDITIIERNATCMKARPTAECLPS